VELAGIAYHWPNLGLIHGFEHLFGQNPLRLANFARATGVGDTVAVPEQRTFAPLFLLSGALLGCMVLVYPLAGETNRIELSGTAYAFCNMFAVGSGGLFQPFIGWLLDLGWDGTIDNGVRVYSAEAYGWAFSVLLVFLACGIAATLAIRESGASRTS
jgi:hypothetical protein